MTVAFARAFLDQNRGRNGGVGGFIKEALSEMTPKDWVSFGFTGAGFVYGLVQSEENRKRHAEIMRALEEVINLQKLILQELHKLFAALPLIVDEAIEKDRLHTLFGLKDRCDANLSTLLRSNDPELIEQARANLRGYFERISLEISALSQKGYWHFKAISNYSLFALYVGYASGVDENNIETTREQYIRFLDGATRFTDASETIEAAAADPMCTVGRLLSAVSYAAKQEETLLRAVPSGGWVAQTKTHDLYCAFEALPVEREDQLDFKFHVREEPRPIDPTGLVKNPTTPSIRDHIGKIFADGTTTDGRTPLQIVQAYMDDHSATNSSHIRRYFELRDMYDDCVNVCRKQIEEFRPTPANPRALPA